MNMVIDPATITNAESLCAFYLEELRLMALKFGIPFTSDIDLLCPLSHTGATLSSV